MNFDEQLSKNTQPSESINYISFCKTAVSSLAYCVGYTRKKVHSASDNTITLPILRFLCVATEVIQMSKL